MDILELQYEILSRLSSQCGSLNLNDFQLETGESATDIEAAARALWTHEPHFVRAFGENIDFLNITDAAGSNSLASNRSGSKKPTRPKLLPTRLRSSAESLTLHPSARKSQDSSLLPRKSKPERPKKMLRSRKSLP